MPKTRLAMAITTVVLVLPAAAGAEEMTVTTTADNGTCVPGDCSLRGAVERADLNLDADDTINVPAGTYQLDAVAGGALFPPGSGTLTIQRSGGGTASIVAAPGSRVFDIMTSGTVTLRGLVITGGHVAGPGGGILHGAGTVVLEDSEVTGNRADPPDDDNAGRGGGIFSDGTLIVTRSVVSGNFAGSAPNLAGGEGAGIHLQTGALTVSDSAVTGNTAEADSMNGGRGAGISLPCDGAHSISRSLVSANVADGGAQGGGLGGGMALCGGTVTVANSTLSGNRAEDSDGFAGGAGGAVGAVSAFGTSVTVEFVNATVAGNEASNGAGIIHTNTTVAFHDTIMANAGESCSDVGPGGGVVPTGRNIENGDSCAFPAGDLTNTDPLLGPLRDNGGPTDTHALLAGSPAIDAAGPACVAVDQRGVARPQRAACDVGAFELAPDPPPAAGGGGGGAAPGPPALADVVRPVLSGVSQTRSTWAVDPNGPAEPRATQRRRRRVGRGTEFRYTLSEAARVVFLVERRTSGRRVGRTCRKPSRRNRRRRPCTRFVRVGSFVQQGAAGANRKPFSGKLGRTRLRPGRYRLTLVATDPAGNRSLPRRLSFRIVSGYSRLGRLRSDA